MVQFLLHCKVRSFLLSIYWSSLSTNFFFWYFQRRQLAVGFGQCQRFIHAWGSQEKRPRLGKSKKKFQTKKPRDLASNAKKELIWHISEKKLFFNVGRWRRWQRLMIRCLPRKVATVICESVKIIKNLNFINILK